MELYKPKRLSPEEAARMTSEEQRAWFYNEHRKMEISHLRWDLDFHQRFYRECVFFMRSALYGTAFLLLASCFVTSYPAVALLAGFAGAMGILSLVLGATFLYPEIQFHRDGARRAKRELDLIERLAFLGAE